MERIKGVEDYLFPAIDATAALLMRCLSYTPPKRSKAGITNAVCTRAPTGLLVTLPEQMHVSSFYLSSLFHVARAGAEHHPTEVRLPGPAPGRTVLPFGGGLSGEYP